MPETQEEPVTRYRYHERYIGKSQRLVQENRFGIWHGYVDSLYRETFTGEDSAKVWLQNQN